MGNSIKKAAAKVRTTGSDMSSAYLDDNSLGICWAMKKSCVQIEKEEAVAAAAAF